MLRKAESTSSSELAVDSIFMTPQLGVLSTVHEEAATQVLASNYADLDGHLLHYTYARLADLTGRFANVTSIDVRTAL